MGSNDPPPPRAFMGSAQNNVVAAISRAAAEQRWMVTREIDMNEIRQLYIRSEHREPLRLAFSEVEFNSIDQTLNALVGVPDDVRLADNQVPVVQYEWDHNSAGESGFFVPKYAMKGATFQPDAPQELVEKYQSINERLQRISWEWGLVRYVFNGLNKNGWCNTAPQMRFVWPAIRHLVGRFDSKLEMSLVDASARAGDKARVPPELVEYMVPTVNIVARSLLIGEVNMNEKRPCVVKMGGLFYLTNNGEQFEAVT